MKKSVVLFKSIYGSSKLYAEDLAEKLNAHVFPIGSADLELSGYETIVFVLPVYAGIISSAGRAVKLMQKIVNKKIVVVTVGLTKDENELENTRKKCFSQISGILFYHLPGVVDFKKLGFVHRNMLAMMNAVLKKKENVSESEKIFLDNFGEVAGALDFEAASDVCKSII